jgi:predicted MPP superfamily phosphohydrolase
MTVAFVVAVAVLLGLLLFLVREVRAPGAADGGRSLRWRKRLLVSLGAIILVLGLLAFWAFLIEPNRLVVREQTVQLANWPSELNGLKVAVISDIHADGWSVNDKKLRLIVERTNQLNPELIVILGDYISSDGIVTRLVQPEEFAVVLKNLRAPLGVYSVLGNHDWWHDGARVRRVLEQNGIRVLENQAVQLNVRGTSMWLVGLSDLWTRPQQIEATVDNVPQGEPMIALAHNPDIFPKLPQRVPLLLAGHTHGGQVTFPLIGTVVHSSDFGERYNRGLVFENNHHLFVTSGIGTSILPVRFGVPPEIVLLTLNSP